MTATDTTQLGADDKPNNLVILIGVIVSCVFIVVSIIGCYLFYRGTQNTELDRKESSSSYLPLKQLRAYEHEELHTLKWINKDRNNVQIPIDMAIQNIIRRYNR